MAKFQRGDRFGKYQILGLLAATEVAEIYDVIAPGGHRRALKVLKEDAGLSKKLRARFAQEGEMIATIDHINVARFFDAGEDAGQGWILMERVHGCRDLRHLIGDAGGKLPVERAVRIVRQACEGVAAAHALGIVHRDLRPENILVTEDDTAKVADFVWAKPSNYGVKTSKEYEVSTALCKAPERLRGRVAGPESDVYSMGLVLYQALTGENPMAPDGATLAEVCSRQLEYEAPALDTLGLGIPGDLAELVRWALCKEPGRRCTMREMADRLGQVLHRLNVHRRAVARGMPVANGDPRLAKTEPAMPAVGGGGTIPMAAVPGLPAAGPGAASGAGAASAAAPSGAPRTWRSEERSAEAQAPRAVERSGVVLVEVARVEVAPVGERASTGAPVERSVTQPGKGGHAWAAVVCGVGAVVALGLVAAGWWIGRGAAAPASGGAAAVGSASAVPAPAMPAPPATVAPAAGSAGSAAAPSTSASAPRRGVAPAPPRPHASPARRPMPFPER